MKTETRTNEKKKESKFMEYEPITGRYIQQERSLLLLDLKLKKTV